jgi:hypothetical protein
MDIVDTMSDEEADDLLSYLEDRDIYTPEVMARIRQSLEEIARGDVITLEELEAELGL